MSSLSAQSDADPALQFTSEQNAGVLQHGRSFQPHVLVVDSDPLMTQLIIRVLRRAGCFVLSADTGAQALDIARQQEVHVIVLDLWIEDMNGFHLLVQLVALQGPRIIVFTDPHHGWAERALQLGAVDFIEKPTPLRRLLEAVKRASGGFQ